MACRCLPTAASRAGGVLGVSVLGAVFSGLGGYASGATFVAGLVPAVTVGAVVVGVGALAALALGRRARRAGAELALAPALEAA